jgi:hypothetical protein
MCDEADEALGVGIRIRCPPRRLHNPDAAMAQQPPCLSAPFGVPIANQRAMRAQWPVVRPRQRATDLPPAQLDLGKRERAGLAAGLPYSAELPGECVSSDFGLGPGCRHQP